MADLHDASIRDVNEARNFITRRHAEYRAVDALCRWILDTLECGEQYKTSTYNANWPYGDVQNLMRHMREYPLETADVQTSAQQWAQIFLGVGNADSPDVRQMAAYNRAARMNYEFRLMRTPTPTHLRRVLDKHLSKIYSQTPRREMRPSPARRRRWPGSSASSPGGMTWMGAGPISMSGCAKPSHRS